MNWIFNNANHLAAPFTILLGLFSAFVGYTSRQRRKRGEPHLFASVAGQRVRALMIVWLVLMGVFGGILLAHNHYAP